MSVLRWSASGSWVGHCCHVRRVPARPGPSPRAPVAELAADPAGPARPRASPRCARRSASGCPTGPTDPAAVVDLLAEAAEPGLTAMPSGRFFGFVMGGTLPAAMAADWLTSAWDQNSGLRVVTPAHTAADDIVGAWLVDLLGLPDRERRRAGHRGDDVELHLPGRRPRRRAAPGRLGRGDPRTDWVAGGSGARRSGAARDRRPRACATSGLGAPRAGRRRRAGPDRSGLAARGAGRRSRTGRRSSCCRRGTSTPGRSTRSSRRSPLRTSTAPGCTWTARSGCSPPPAQRHRAAGVRRRRRRLLDDRRAQDAQRPLRLRHRRSSGTGRRCARRWGCTART